MTYTLQNWSKIFFDRPIILGTSFSDFAENYHFLPFSCKPGPESIFFTSVTLIIFKFYIYPRYAISLDKLMWPTGPKSQYFEIFLFSI